MIFAIGALVGLLSFSKLLKYLFKNYENITLALLTGFILGSLNKVWPWKQTISVLNNDNGLISPMINISDYGTLAVMQRKTQDFDTYKAVVEESIFPNFYTQINQLDASYLNWAIILMLTGFVTIFILEKLGQKL